MRPYSTLASVLLTVPVALLSTSLLAPATGGAQSSGSAGSLGSSDSASGPCNNFLGNFPPNSLGLNLATGSLANAANSVAGVAASSVRDFPRWITSTQGTVPVLKGATSVRQLVTGPTSPAKTDSAYNIYGTDLGIMFEHGDETMVLFGDTFGACTPTSNDWRSNVMLTAENGTPTDGLKITGARPSEDGQASALVQGAHQPNGTGEVTVIPTAAISANNAMYMRVMSVRDWNAPGGWNTNYSALVKSVDNGATWKVLTDSMRRVTDFTGWNSSVQFESDDDTPPAVEADRWYGMQMSAFLEDGEYLYEYLTPSGRRGPATLARVPLDRIEDPAAYTWFKGGTTWESDPEGSELILPAPVEELSVAYNEYLDQFISLTSTATGVVSMRVASRPEGPWSAPQTLVDRRMFPNAYAPMIHPASITSDGEHLFYTLSTWDAYNVFLLRTDLGEFDFNAPNTDTHTAVQSRVAVATAVEAGAIDDGGVIDEQRLEEVAAAAPAPPESIVEPAGR
ncbi:DUF4185 domain-containing protein [Dietzia cercidiphylli]|uniref:DUF4185 domain-containing protein n=1 Tax=Dietzia cercidiphylli TaxID=498199 RepID=A0ABN2IP90_9ACTN|nr:DUF4185 domain-containing protein [Dietzia cercidiphylli]MBB1049061.1 DUF4185 domain-containing protein [Dietzia cercidiphylli]MDZ4235019.1 DUF4185 domain-containing protein [Dietzia sp.]